MHVQAVAGVDPAVPANSVIEMPFAAALESDAIHRIRDEAALPVRRTNQIETATLPVHGRCTDERCVAEKCASLQHPFPRDVLPVCASEQRLLSFDFQLVVQIERDHHRIRSGDQGSCVVALVRCEAAVRIE